MRTNLWLLTSSASWLNLAPGSALVSRDDTPADAERVVCYFEGNVNGAGNITSYADRALHAADRMISNYPTVAQAALEPRHLLLVGSYDTDTGEISIDPDHRLAVCAWLDVTEAELEPELHSTSARHLAQRELRTMSPVQADWLRRHGPPVYRDA